MLHSGEGPSVRRHIFQVAVPTLAAIARHLSINARIVAAHYSGNLALVMSSFKKDGNLFVLGEMCVFRFGQL